MTMTTRHAMVRWAGDLNAGGGKVVASTSGVLNEARVSWPARTKEPDTTSPEEMLAAAHASCFAMALAHGLVKEGFLPTELVITATVSFEERDGAWTITKSALDVVGSVPGISEPAFTKFAAKAKDSCPVSRALSPAVEIVFSASMAAEQLAAAAGP